MLIMNEGVIPRPLTDAGGRGVPLTLESSGLETFRKWVVAGQHAICRRNLAPPRHTEFLPQRVCVCLCRAWRDSEPLTDFVVRAAECDQPNDFNLTSRERGGRI